MEIFDSCIMDCYTINIQDHMPCSICGIDLNTVTVSTGDMWVDNSQIDTFCLFTDVNCCSECYDQDMAIEYLLLLKYQALISCMDQKTQAVQADINRIPPPSNDLDNPRRVAAIAKMEQEIKGVVQA